MVYQFHDKVLVAKYLTNATGYKTSWRDLDLPFQGWMICRENYYDKAVSWAQTQRRKKGEKV